jgi:hypothetical protein
MNIKEMDAHMRNNALYFPFINVPNNSWFFRILLYWEKVSSIVPYDFVTNPNQFSDNMRDLVCAELVEQVMPMDYLDKIPCFEESFLDYVDQQIILRGNDHINLLVNPFLIHIEKMGDIANRLLELGVAKCGNYPWYKVERWVGEAFMTYLATTLGMLPEINAAPVTDDWNNFQIFNRGTIPTNYYKSSEVARIRQLLLDNLLPSPEEPIDIDKLIRFKTTYGKQLSNLRNTIEGSCAEIANITDDEAREVKIETFLYDIKNDVDTITNVMKSNWKRITLGTLIPMLGSSASLLLLNPITNPLEFAAAGLSFIGTTYRAFNGVHLSEQVINQPLAYVAFASNRYRQTLK